jgi:hypothetical protein
VSFQYCCVRKEEALIDTDRFSTRKKLKTPRAAAISGILFALLYGAGLALIRSSIPSNPSIENITWLVNNAKNITLGLNLIPFAGIAFLWFIGVIRDRLGDMEDRLFATVFLGSGLLFLALNFVGAAMAAGLLSSYPMHKEALLESGVYTYSRIVMSNVINIYAIRMAGVFMISLGTIWLRTGLMHRVWVFITYALALLLLLSVSFSAILPLVFPGWVLAVSVYLLILNLKDKPQKAESIP